MSLKQQRQTNTMTNTRDTFSIKLSTSGYRQAQEYDEKDLSLSLWVICVCFLKKIINKLLDKEETDKLINK